MLGTIEQVKGIETLRIITGVTGPVNRELAVMHMVRNAMRLHHLAHIPNLTIAAGVQATGPI